MQPTLIYDSLASVPGQNSLDVSRANVGFVAGDRPHFSEETAALVRSRLSAAALVIAVVLGEAVGSSEVLLGGVQEKEATWKKHIDSNGDELGDEEGSVQAEGTTPAISIQGVSCTVTHCIVHHNGDVGIGILGKEKTRTAPTHHRELYSS